MKMTLAILLMVLGGTLSAAEVAPKPVDKGLIKKMVDQYYFLKENAFVISKHAKPMHRNCDDDNTSQECIDYACEKLGHFGCDDLEEVTQVGEACRGNYNSSCLEFACEKVGHFGCDTMSEVRRLARACVGNYSTSCAESVCERLGHFGCDDHSEIESVLDTCAGR